MMHYTAINANIGKEFEDWNNGDFFSAGRDTANAFTLLFGPAI
jgi:hypothetical protein